MDIKILAALISGSISLVIALVSFFTIKFKISNENKKFIINIRDQYNIKLYELRLNHYPEAFLITDNLGKKNGINDIDLPKFNSEIIIKLRKWKAGGVGMILSECSLQAYYNLLNSFRAKLALGDRYNKEQLERIYNLRTEFRNCLRDDVGMLFNLDKEEDND